MAEVYAEYNGDLLTPEQIEVLHGGLIADLGAMAADGEPEGTAEVEAGAEAG